MISRSNIHSFLFSHSCCRFTLPREHVKVCWNLRSTIKVIRIASASSIIQLSSGWLRNKPLYQVLISSGAYLVLEKHTVIQFTCLPVKLQIISNFHDFLDLFFFFFLLGVSLVYVLCTWMHPLVFNGFRLLQKKKKTAYLVKLVVM